MLLNLLVKLHPDKVYVCGLDGYRLDGNNYYQNRLEMHQDNESIMAINEAMTHKINNLKTKLSIEFVTPSLYLN